MIDGTMGYSRQQAQYGEVSRYGEISQQGLPATAGNPRSALKKKSPRPPPPCKSSLRRVLLRHTGGDSTQIFCFRTGILSCPETGRRGSTVPHRASEQKTEGFWSKKRSEATPNSTDKQTVPPLPYNKHKIYF
ncbi:hypothetical protein [Treponema endosymbiont of Eucomonympha sp.]|uniref:hypothetical protein n=1 Tax=Treponema endosymbiont of Eucomonympha sp. TaxID=1580831 RepID=UPI00164F551C|nr:hypothetical protein [Treponema endosymbiont of Eucomonympha sp.]